MRDQLRFLGGGFLLGLAGLWKLKGPQWGVLAALGPFPDVTKGDVLAVPAVVGGLALLASAPGISTRRRLLGIACLVGAVLWVTSELPWDDPLIPGLQRHHHGVHLLDVLALVPLAVACSLLWPRWHRSGRLVSAAADTVTV